MYVNGRQIKDIVAYLNDNGVRSSQGKPIGKTTVTAFLQNRKYIGEYQYRDVVVPNGVPAIISKELFALAMDRLEKNKYAPSTYKAYDRYLLSTKLICGCCGATMVGESGTGRNDKEIMDSIVSRVLQWQEQENITLPLLALFCSNCPNGNSISRFVRNPAKQRGVVALPISDSFQIFLCYANGFELRLRLALSSLSALFLLRELRPRFRFAEPRKTLGVDPLQ